MTAHPTGAFVPHPHAQAIMEGNRFISRGKMRVLIGFADILEVEQMNTDPWEGGGSASVRQLLCCKLGEEEIGVLWVYRFSLPLSIFALAVSPMCTFEFWPIPHLRSPYPPSSPQFCFLFISTLLCDPLGLLKLYSCDMPAVDTFMSSKT